MFNIDTKITLTQCVQNDPFKEGGVTSASQSLLPELSLTRYAKALFTTGWWTVTEEESQQRPLVAGFTDHTDKHKIINYKSNKTFNFCLWNGPNRKYF